MVIEDVLIGLAPNGSEVATTDIGVHIVSDVTGVVVRHCRIAVDNTGVQAQGATSNTTIELNEISSPAAGNTGTVDGISLLSLAGDANVIRHNRVRDMGGAGVEIGGAGPVAGLVVRGQYSGTQRRRLRRTVDGARRDRDRATLGCLEHSR